MYSREPRTAFTVDVCDRYKMSHKFCVTILAVDAEHNDVEYYNDDTLYTK